MQTIVNLFTDATLLPKPLGSAANYLVDNKSILAANNALSIASLPSLLTRLEQEPVCLAWTSDAWDAFSDDPTALPAAAILALHSNVSHIFQGSNTSIQLIEIRKKINNARAVFDWFGDRSFLCADHLGLGTPTSLYKDPVTRGLRSREEFEEAIFPFVQALIAINVGEEAAFLWRESLSSIIYELIENTEIHARSKSNGAIVRPSIRGIIFRQQPFFQYFEKQKAPIIRKNMLELIVFDCGQGYYEKYTGTALTDQVSASNEASILNRCLASHYEGDTNTSRWGVHGIGLYEVLRGLKFLRGAIEVRSGRLHMYRSFIDGDMPLRLEAQDQSKRPGMPKAELLDLKNRVITKPSLHNKLIGSVVRIVIPFGREEA
jgi:hypothetical protein